MNDVERKMTDWWSTDIIEMQPGMIRYRGYAIEELIGNVSFAQMIWLMTRGELPSREQAELLDIALMSAVDHGPQAPSIAIARMAATCGVGLNSAMASAINVLGDVHGGAGEQAVEMFLAIAERMENGSTMDEAVRDEYDAYTSTKGKYLPGFGHRFHPVDPRAPRLLEMVDQAAAKGAVSGRYAQIARKLEAEIAISKGKAIPMNIDGATAVIYAELEFPRRWHEACSACRGRWASWPTPGSKPSREDVTRAQFQDSTSGTIRERRSARCPNRCENRLDLER